MMDNETTQALDRIGRALSRIEAIGSDTDPAGQAALVALTERHDRLRNRIRETIDRLDTLIGDASEEPA